MCEVSNIWREGVVDEQKEGGSACGRLDGYLIYDSVGVAVKDE